MTFSLSAMGQTMTLGECIRRGIDQNIDVANTRIGMSRGSTTVSQSRARLLPVVNASAQFTGYFQNPVTVTTGALLDNDFADDPTWQKVKGMPYNASAGFGLSMPLYDKTLYASIQAAKTIEEMSRLSYDKAVETITVQIAKAYSLAQTSKAEIRLADGNIGRMKELCDITSALYEQGVVMEVDLNRVRINLKNLQAQRDGYQSLFRQHLNLLRFLMNMTAEEPLDVTDMPEDISPFGASGVDNCLPDLQLAEKQQEYIDREIRQVKAGYLPKLSLHGFAGAVGYQDNFGHFFHTHEATDNWFGDSYLGFSVSITLFDAKQKRLKIRQYNYQAQQAANTTTQLRQNLERQHADARLQLSHNSEVFHTQKDNYRQAQSVYDVTEDQYKEGVASMTSLLQDDMQLRSAQQACVEAHCQYDLARIDLLRLSGQLSLLNNEQH
jgi:outer membrane protein